MRVFLAFVFISMLYATLVGQELKQKEEESRRELQVLEACREKAKQECGQGSAGGNLSKLCGLIVKDVALWGSYSCKPFRFYASGKHFILREDRAIQK